MFVSVVVNLVMVTIRTTSVIMFYMISNPHQHKNDAFLRRGELFPIWELAVLQLYCEQRSSDRPYTVTPSINTDLEGGSDMVNVVWKMIQ